MRQLPGQSLYVPFNYAYRYWVIPDHLLDTKSAVEETAKSGMLIEYLFAEWHTLYAVWVAGQVSYQDSLWFLLKTRTYSFGSVESVSKNIKEILLPGFQRFMVKEIPEHFGEFEACTECTTCHGLIMLACFGSSLDTIKCFYCTFVSSTSNDGYALSVLKGVNPLHVIHAIIK